MCMSACPKLAGPELKLLGYNWWKEPRVRDTFGESESSLDSEPSIQWGERVPTRPEEVTIV